METPIYDVSDAVGVLNQTLAYAYPDMTIVGELANFKIAKGRWIYADLKDDDAKLRIFGSVFNLPGPLEDGMMVQVVAEPRVHPQFGFSLNIKSIKPVGEGSLKKAADLLKLKLEQEGLFAPERKKSLPYAPEKVGLITSGQSAAYADFVKILNARWQGVEVRLYDVAVQGEAAVGEILEALTHFNQESVPVDAVVLIRGGGSADDLAAFSTEQVTRAVAASRIPTLVAIGHEIDISLAELAADMRASTPSNAAELLFPDRRDEMRRLSILRERLSNVVENYLVSKQQELSRTKSDLGSMIEKVLDAKLQNLAHASALLEAVHPRTTLKRGYALVQNEKGKLVSSVAQTKKDDSLKLTFADGETGVRVE